MTEQALVTNEKQPPAVSGSITSPTDLLAMAVQQDAPLEKLEKLMDLQERWNKSEAKRAFDSALAAFQAELGPILKTRQGHNSKYADIDDIAQAIRPLLKDNGLAYRFEQNQEGERINVTCVVTHAQGHSEKASLLAPADDSGGKNDIQSMASTITYLRRYTLTGALGITTGNDDNDGGKPDITVDELLQHMATVREELPSIMAVKDHLLNNEFSAAKEAWHELDQETQKALWRAPSKGGIFTTEERAKMKSNEWTAA